MADELEQKMENLQEEMPADAFEDEDLLADMPIEILDTTPIKREEINNTETEAEEPEEIEEPEIPEEPVETEEPAEAEEAAEPEETEEELSVAMKKSRERSRIAKQREDRHLVTLMAIASFLCLGIIAMLVYWLEVFLK